MLYSSAKSVPNWLDRLRSNKGFPAADNNLEHFLLTSSSSDSPNCPNHTELSSSLVVVSQQNRRRPEKISELMSNAISELFFIDGSDESSRLSNSKLPRKQTHPKVHVSLRSSRSRSRSRLGNDVNALDKVGGDDEAEEERGGGGGGEREMKGYSKSEVTVIDTSCEVWKTEKVLFRRKSVWKVREKRTKVRSFGRNKRKCDDDDDDDKKMEKKKKKNKEEAKDVDEDQCTSIQHIEGQNSQNDARKEVCEVSTDTPNERGKEFSREDVPDNNRKHIKKGFSLNRLPRKTVKDGLSVVFIKGIPTDEKNEGKLPKKFVKDSQRKYKT